ncbi:MAG: universal stress protein, partial [Gemmatimonadaceae bacterium]
RILVPLDWSALAADALGPAVDLARATGARIVLLQVVFPVPLVSVYDANLPIGYPLVITDDTATDKIIRATRLQLDEFARRLQDETGVDAFADVVGDSRVADSIVRFAKSHDVDAIAMSTHGRGASRWVLGSVADKVLRGGELPVLLHRPLGLADDASTSDGLAEGELSSLAHAD